jgi:hypothetical protein
MMVDKGSLIYQETNSKSCCSYFGSSWWDISLIIDSKIGWTDNSAIGRKSATKIGSKAWVSIQKRKSQIADLNFAVAAPKFDNPKRDIYVGQKLDRRLLSRRIKVCFGSVNPLINCRNGLLKTEGPLNSVPWVKLTIYNSSTHKRIQECRDPRDQQEGGENTAR